MEIPSGENLTVGMLYELMWDKLCLESVNGSTGHDRKVLSPDISRPGMALTGYLHKFLHERIQIFGETEISYLQSLSEREREEALRNIFRFPVYCCIVTKGLAPPGQLVELCTSKSAALFRSRRDTTPLIHDLCGFLETVFAPSTNLYGTLVEVYGAGLLCTGKSAIGKSEAVLGLIERGHHLIADDRVHVKKIGNSLVGSGDPGMAHRMEIRGLGLVDVSAFYGIRAVKSRQQIHLEVNLKEWSRENQEFDRTGLFQKVSTILDIPIPKIVIPVLPGRNLTLLLEVAVMNYLLLQNGRNVPEEVERELIGRILAKESGTGNPRHRHTGGGIEDRKH